MSHVCGLDRNRGKTQTTASSLINLTDIPLNTKEETACVQVCACGKAAVNHPWEHLPGDCRCGEEDECILFTMKTFIVFTFLRTVRSITRIHNHDSTQSTLVLA